MTFGLGPLLVQLDMYVMETCLLLAAYDAAVLHSVTCE